MGKNFDAIERAMNRAFQFFENNDLRKANQALNEAFRALMEESSRNNVDLGWVEELWMALA